MVVDIEVDVVIPTLVWDYVEETLDSIDAQLGVTARPIIVNDSGEPAPPTGPHRQYTRPDRGRACTRIRL